MILHNWICIDKCVSLVHKQPSLPANKKIGVPCIDSENMAVLVGTKTENPYEFVESVDIYCSIE